ncbi:MULTISPECIES: ABC transporter ATP-binding protein [Chelatococcus]|uniref:ABC transporter ATP-binding protein n=2 Tax=Chelatococcaceae TaxID=2036754 RepID=UPI001BD05B16|nr:ABC transporter ATP-binding protein [Chelatococcus asaccharovorans]MBS7695748.1 ABC transporter ATP-binding protein [Chelatococcus sp. YT9]CAH1648004.1 taurine ABC transporter ATP binding subunit [Hyphomicrobiales bacterium]CAH1657170.1 taurine ABC transporter ATP binding subunit [Chelatococcus asaccharovorans]CAH1661004.1 taurine ABC transporter ATP binding subunit [Hyphomicrobiales bacterium]CAH1693332.1 taurine ABC transporter ATP binding subunit [Hyphomicrobiales bacterium]
MNSINVRDISKVFPGGLNRSKVIALHNISLSINSGEFICIIGPSGCGKTTLLHMIAGFTFPTNGEVLYKGHPISGPGPERIVIFQEYGLFPWFTVRENIEFGLRAKGLARSDRNSIVRDYISLVGLAGFENRYPKHISGGMKQRVGIARALAADPDVVLMDEPFGALDSLTRDQMQEEILRIWEQRRKTVVLITHSIDEAIFLADRVFVMTARPGTIKEVVDIELPRPRDPEMRSTSQKFLAYKEHLTHSLRKEIGSILGQ